MPYKDIEKQRASQRKHYEANKDKFRERLKLRRKERREWFDNITNGIKCVVCGEEERICLDFHHTNPKDKDSTVTKLLNDFRSKERVLNEIKKCKVLCSNCHRKVHANIIKL